MTDHKRPDREKFARILNKLNDPGLLSRGGNSDA